MAQHIKKKEKYETKIKRKPYGVTFFIRKEKRKEWKPFDTSLDLELGNNKKKRKMRYVLREDQWICTRCGTENKKDRRVCCKCKAFIKYADRSDDWYCPANDCARSNYGSRSVCFKCGTARQEAGEIFDSENFDINCRLQIHNLNYETTEEEVQEFFFNYDFLFSTAHMYL